MRLPILPTLVLILAAAALHAGEPPSDTPAPGSGSEGDGGGGSQIRGTATSIETGAPLVGGYVEVVESGVRVPIAADGTFAVPVGEGRAATLLAVPSGGDPSEAIRWVAQSPERPARLRAWTGGATSAGVDALPEWGAPLARRPSDADAPDAGPVSWHDFLPGNPIALSFPGELPETIRVGRRFADSCSGNPVQRIDTVPLEEYVEGVLLPEIGVFRSVEGGPESAAEVFKAFAVAARTYALWFYFREPDAEFHLDDTACNQRYEESRNAWVAEQVEATRGQILVQATDPGVIDKYEYAASCGRHGTRPEYQDALVPDLTGTQACVGSWCGHDRCAAHEVNPEFPDEGRCLVRGICQWGAVERSMNGDPYLEILAHYQPNLQVFTVVDEDTTTRLRGYVRAGDLHGGMGVPGVTVTLDGDATTVTDAAGLYGFEPVAPGPHTLDYAGGGIEAVSQDVDVVEGRTNWASIAVWLESAEDVGVDAGADVGADVGVPDADVSGADADVPDADEDATTGPVDATPNPLPMLSIVDDGLAVERGCATVPERTPSGGAFLLVGLAAVLVRRVRH